jgi:hypothetical protein
MARLSCHDTGSGPVRLLLIAAVLMSLGFTAPGHAQNICEAAAHDAAAMAHRRNLGMGPEPGALEAARAVDERIYEINLRRTDYIYSHPTSQADEAAMIGRSTCYQVFSQPPPHQWNHAPADPP